MLHKLDTIGEIQRNTDDYEVLTFIKEVERKEHEDTLMKQSEKLFSLIEEVKHTKQKRFRNCINTYGFKTKNNPPNTSMNYSRQQTEVRSSPRTTQISDDINSCNVLSESARIKKPLYERNLLQSQYNPFLSLKISSDYMSKGQIFANRRIDAHRHYNNLTNPYLRQNKKIMQQINQSYEFTNPYNAVQDIVEFANPYSSQPNDIGGRKAQTSKSGFSKRQVIQAESPLNNATHINSQNYLKSKHPENQARFI